MLHSRCWIAIYIGFRRAHSQCLTIPSIANSSFTPGCRFFQFVSFLKLMCIDYKNLKKQSRTSLHMTSQFWNGIIPFGIPSKFNCIFCVQQVFCTFDIQLFPFGRLQYSHWRSNRSFFPFFQSNLLRIGWVIFWSYLPSLIAFELAIEVLEVVVLFRPLRRQF